MTTKGIIKFVFTWSLILYLFIYVVDLKSLSAILLKADGRYLLIAYLIHFSGILLCTCRWKLILKAKNIAINYISLLRIYLAGIFYNNFLPGTIGGDAYKAHKVFKEEHFKNYSFIDFAGSVFLDRFFGLLTTISIATLIIVFKSKIVYPSPFWTISEITLSLYSFGLLFFFILFFISKYWPFFHKIPNSRFNYSLLLNRISASVDIFSNFQHQKRNICTITIISFLFYCISYIGTPYYLLCSLHTPIDYLSLLYLLPFLNLIIMLPISIGGIGIRETTYVYFLSFLDISPEVSIAVGLLISAMTIINGIIGGIIDLIVSRS